MGTKHMSGMDRTANKLPRIRKYVIPFYILLLVINIIIFIAELFTWSTIFAIISFFIVLLFPSALLLRKGTKGGTKRKKIFIGMGVILFCIVLIYDIRVIPMNAWTRVDRGSYTFEIRNNLLWNSQKIGDGSYAYGNRFYISEEESDDKKTSLDREKDISSKMKNYAANVTDDVSILYSDVQTGHVGMYPSIRGDMTQRTSSSKNETHSRDMYFYATDSIIVHMGYIGIPEGQTVPDLQHTFDSVKLK